MQTCNRTKLEPDENTPEHCARHIIGLLDKLPDSLRKMWNDCRSKIFDFGFDSGFAPCAFHADLSPASLQEVAATGASVRFTIYPVQYKPIKEDALGSPEPL